MNLTVIDRVIWGFIIPALLHIPLIRRIPKRLCLKKVASIITSSVEGYNKITQDEDWNKPPLCFLRPYAMLMALMPVVLLYHHLKGAKQ